MRKSLIIIWIICLIIISIIFVACDNSTENENSTTEIITEQTTVYNPYEYITPINSWNCDFALLYNKETNIMYSYSLSNVGNRKFVQLVNADGTPKLYNGDIETIEDVFVFLPYYSYNSEARFIYDKKTLVMYINDNGNLILLENVEGTPELYNKDKNIVIDNNI